MRAWHGRENDGGSVHCIGNGKMCVYGQGPDIIQLFGSPYSSPSFIRILLRDESISAQSDRRRGAAVWDHLLNGRSAATDFVDWDIPCFARRVRTDSPLTFGVELDGDIRIVDNTRRFTGSGYIGGYIFYAPAGRYFYNDYPLNKKIFFQLLISGNASAEEKVSGVEITCSGGTSYIYIIGGMDYPECCLNAEKTARAGFEGMLGATLLAWNAFTAAKNSLDHVLTNNNALTAKYADILDSVPILIKTQQSEEGGVLAGYPYHMAYVRDQYGVFRCLLKLGYYNEAKKIIAFYYDIWLKAGCIHNAQPMGWPAPFHVHENDDVEITGYLILQSFDYLAATGDVDFIRQIIPMLQWAFDAEKKHVVKGMLPFNGDETYVAGGVLPRVCLNDGSAEATMLFIAGGEKLMDWMDKNKMCDAEELRRNRSVLTDARNRYHDNFFRDGHFITNNPERKDGMELPAFRHGVCEGCLAAGGSGPFFFGWTEKNENGRYLCPSCIVGNNLGKAADTAYSIQSVSLVPLYIGSDLLSEEEIRNLLEPITRQYAATGRLPSRPDGDITVGYDYGLLLYTLTKLNHPLAEEIFRITMDAIDPAGAWAEYYRGGAPAGTRCRPWESGVNLEAVIDYIALRGASCPT